MSVFTVLYSYVADDDLRMATRAAHREYMEGIDGLLVAGAFAATEPAGGLLVFRAADREAVEKIVAGDPYATAGVVSSTGIKEWVPALGTAVKSFG